MCGLRIPVASMQETYTASSIGDFQKAFSANDYADEKDRELSESKRMVIKLVKDHELLQLKYDDAKGQSI
jgi:hypothetical protein